MAWTPSPPEFIGTTGKKGSNNQIIAGIAELGTCTRLAPGTPMDSVVAPRLAV